MASRIEKLKKFEANFVRKDIPSFEVGDTVRMKIKVQEADKIRLHSWEGLVIGKRGAGIKEVFTVRKISFGEGVEKAFPIHSPVIDSIKVISKGKVKRAKLFYLRDRSGKSARIQTTVVRETAEAPVAA